MGNVTQKYYEYINATFQQFPTKLLFPIRKNANIVEILRTTSVWKNWWLLFPVSPRYEGSLNLKKKKINYKK